MFDLSSWPMWVVFAVFAASAVIIAVAGTIMTKDADRLADLTGLGEALFGALFLGASTSAPGIITSVSTAWQGHPSLSISNAVGGIAAQTVFLAIADITYRKANLEHAAASLPNMIQGTLLVSLISLPILYMAAPEIAIWSIHPGTFVLVFAYVMGLRIAKRAGEERMWKPRQTSETKEDKPEAEEDDGGLTGFPLWARFLGLVAIVAIAGYMIAQTGVSIATRTGLSESVVGALLTAIATSLPELITCIAAVRHGALTLAVSDIIGGNAFDVMFLAASDVAYREGSIYHEMTASHLFLIALAVLMTTIVVMGLLRRQKEGFGKIGFESTLLLALYVAGSIVLVIMEPSGSGKEGEQPTGQEIMIENAEPD